MENFAICGVANDYHNSVGRLFESREPTKHGIKYHWSSGMGSLDSAIHRNELFHI